MDLDAYKSLPHATAFSGRSSLADYYKAEPGVGAGEIEEALSGSGTYTQMRQAKRPAAYNPTFVHTYGDLQIDLLQINTLKNYNRGISFYLVVEDCFSRYCWTRPLKKKTAAACRAAFEEILEEIPFRVKRVTSDGGGEFRGTFEQMLKDKGIQKTIARRHAAYVERLIGTIKTILSKAMKENETLVHADIFAGVIESYNGRRHRILKMSPAQALDPRLTDRIRYEHALEWAKREQTFRTRTPKFHVGDLVRPQLPRDTWSRSFHQTFDSEIHRVTAVLVHLPVPMFVLKHLDGRPVKERKYAAELQKVKDLSGLRIEKVFWNKKKKKVGEDGGGETELVLVKYAELPSAFNDYVPVESLSARKRVRKRIWS